LGRAKKLFPLLIKPQINLGVKPEAENAFAKPAE